MTTPSRIQIRMSHVRLFLLEYARPDAVDSLIDTIQALTDDANGAADEDVYILAKLVQVRKTLGG